MPFKEKKPKTSTSHNADIELENNLENNNSIDLNEPADDSYEIEISEKSEAEQIISFNLMIKSFTGPTLPSK